MRSHRSCRWPRVPLSLPLPSPLLPPFPIFLPPPPAWPRLEHLPRSSAPLCSLHLLPQGCSGAGAPIPGFPWQCLPSSSTVTPGMSPHRSAAVPSPSGWTPRVKRPPKTPGSLKPWCGHPGWGPRPRAGVAMAGGSSLAQVGFHGDVTVHGDTSSLIPGLRAGRD